MSFFKGYRPMWFQRMICKHDYTLVHTFMIDSGMGKMFALQCKKCGKARAEFL